MTATYGIDRIMQNGLHAVMPGKFNSLIEAQTKVGEWSRQRPGVQYVVTIQMPHTQQPEE